MGIKALERQSGEDCVIREKVKNKAIQLWNGSGDEDYKFNTLIDYITDLPPVTPTHKVAKWLYHMERDDYNDYENEYYECSNCHTLDADKSYHYCPNCGADMRGDENE